MFFKKWVLDEKRGDCGFMQQIVNLLESVEDLL